MGLRLCVAGLGYRIVKESLFKVGAAAPGSVLSTRGGNIELGFEVYPLDGAPEAVTRLGGASLPASRLHLTEGNGSLFKILFKDAAWPCNVFILRKRFHGW